MHGLCVCLIHGYEAPQISCTLSCAALCASPSDPHSTPRGPRSLTEADDRTKKKGSVSERHARASREDVCPHPAVVQQNHIRGLFLPPFRCHCTSQGNHEWPSYSATHEALLGLPLSQALQMQKEGRRGEMCISFSPSSPRPAHAPSHSFTPPFPLSPTTHRVGSCPTRV
jgi:hypothetical protein